MTWRPANSLLVLHRQLQEGSRAAPPATGRNEWGLLGDAAHDPTSDHSPHDFRGWGNDIVTAADFPNRPDLGLDAHKALDDIRRSRDPRVKYGISNGEQFSSYAVTKGGVFYPAWAWRPYNPKNGDRHFTHGHLSVVGDARADGTQPWATIGGTDMFEAADRALLAQVVGVCARLDSRVTTLLYNTPTNQWDPQKGEGNGLRLMLDAIAREAGVDAGELAQIEAAAKEGAKEAFAEQQATFIAALIAALPQDRDGNLSIADVETAVRSVFADAGSASA